MSGRSAYVRKKIITEATKDGKNPAGRGRTHSATSPDGDDATIPDFPLPVSGGGSLPVGTGVGTTNARFLKFSEQMRDADPSVAHQNTSTMSISSGGSGGSAEGHQRGALGMGMGMGMGMTSMGHHQRDEYGFEQQRRPTLKTEDVSGIERSSLRNIMDKTSGDVRKGLAKTFAFKRKDKDGRRASVDKSPDETVYPSQSSATARPHVPDATHIQSEHRPMANVPGPDVYFSQGAAVQRQYPHQNPLQNPPQNQLPSPQGTSPPWDGLPIRSPPPIDKSLPPVPPPSTAPPIRRWTGSGRPVQRWNKLRKDPELWDPNGDVLVFLGHRGQKSRPNPSFRLSSHIIEATGSRHITSMLREGSIEEDINLLPSPQGAPPMAWREPKRGGAGGTATEYGQPTPPVSEDTSLGDADGQISYEMYFPTPANMTKIEQLRFHIATRNVFALLCQASIVGITLYQALADLQTRLEAYKVGGNPGGRGVPGIITDYLSARGIDDVRDDADTAVSLLAWSEGTQVRWDEGWRECFIHCAGMYDREVEEKADFKHLMPITRALLERASLETQLRVQAAAERLAELQCHEMWPASGPVASGQAKAAADRLQKFLLDHYSRVYGSWPPPSARQRRMAQAQGQGQAQGQAHQRDDQDGKDDGSDEDNTWLTRTVAQELQRDFGALYDYLVRRDIVWDVSEARAGRKWMMASASGDRSFAADTADLPLTDMVVEFDNKMRFPHIPHPYPLVPEPVPRIPAASPAGGGGNDAGTGAAARSAKLDRRAQLAYTEASNVYVLGSELAQSDLVDAFVKFEKSDHVGGADAALARRGRWVLLYGVLQTLASVGVDAPGVRYKDGVPYHLSPRLKGTRVPPWKGSDDEHRGQGRSGKGSRALGGEEEASHELSHCWVVPRTWNGVGGVGVYGDGEGEGEGEGEEEEEAGGSTGEAWASGRAGPSGFNRWTGTRKGGSGDFRAGRGLQSGGSAGRNFDGYAEGSTAGLYSYGRGRDQDRGGNVVEAEGSGQVAKIRDFDLDVIDDVEP